jgi:hypothetical protein
MASLTQPTLYPKITTHIGEITKALKDLYRGPESPEVDTQLDPISFVGTVKLHGTHADIRIDSDDRIVLQSRNVVDLQPAKDNAGFATAMSKKTKALLRLRDIIITRFVQLNPNMPIERDQPVLIAGEWIGQSIQKGVAVSQLSKRFVIISISINGRWQNDSDYGCIALPNHDIYNVSRAGVFKSTLHPEDPQRTIAELEILADQVAAQCPFAATFGLEGAGEGIVWKPAEAAYNANPALWFKTKGGRFKPTFVAPHKQSTDGSKQKREVAAAVARVWASEQRLEQGLEYLQEIGTKREMRALSMFLKWVQNDIMVEEKGCIAEQKIDKQTLNIEIAKIAKVWYIQRL